MQTPVLAAFDLTQIALLAMAVAVLTLLMLTTRRRFVDRQSSSGESVRERYARLGQRRDAVRDVESVMLDLDRLARDVHGRLDLRMAKLDAIIADADRRIAELRRLATSANEQDSADGAAADSSPSTADHPTDRRSGSRRGGASVATAPTPDAAHLRVHRLADEGRSASAIAAEIDRPIGEVELILNLRSAAAPDVGAPVAAGASNETARSQQPV